MIRGKKKNLKFIPLGGVGEIGKNMSILEYDDEIIILDCGLTFPDDDMPGIDIVIPDITYLLKNIDRVKALFLTHGHEDHIGAVPYLLKQMNIPVYGTKLTLGLVETKLNEHKLSKENLILVNQGETIKTKHFSIEYITACHSIPDSVCFGIKTPVGNIFFTGDFKIDYTPIDGDKMDLHRIAQWGNEGVMLLCADSTNVERPGYTLSESSVGETFIELFSKATGRIIVATFASNLHRVQQIITAAEKFNRKVVISGRSMVNVVKVATELGKLKINDGTLLDIKDINRYDESQIVLLMTGSQGEPMSALNRMAYGEHKKLVLTENDTVIISASPIPGNEKIFFGLVNRLVEMGVKVIYSSLADVHVSGHACQEELKLIHTLVRPKYFIPVHGESRHLKTHAKLAVDMGTKEENIFVGRNGMVFEFNPKGEGYISGTVEAGNILVDGLGVGDVGSAVLRDRKHLSEDGIIIVMIVLEKISKEIISGPEIISRGFIYVKENLDIVSELRKIVQITLDNCREDDIRDIGTMRYNIRKDLNSYIYNEFKRGPMIIPIITEL